MTRTRILTAALLSTSLGLGLGTALLAPAAEAQRAQQTQEKKPQGDAVRPEMGKLLAPAQDLLKQKKAKEALAKIREADAMPDKSAYESFVIDQMEVVAFQQLGDTAGMERGINGLINSGRLDASQQQQFMRALAYGFYQAKDYKKSIEWAQRFQKAGGNDDKMADLIKQAQFLGGDMTAAGKEARVQIAAAEKGGKAPDKVDLELLATVGLKTNDQATYMEALEKLVRYYPTPQYWEDLLIRTQKTPGFSRDRLSLDVLRFKRAVGLLDQAPEFTEAAELAMQANLPGEAKTFLEEGFGKGILGSGPEAERQKRLLAGATKLANEDQATLAGTEREASGSPTGGPLVRLGEAYAGYGQAAKGAELMQKGIAKGGLKNPEDAKLRYATMLYAAGKKAEAVKAFQAVKGTDGPAALARLWVLRLSQVG